MQDSTVLAGLMSRALCLLLAATLGCSAWQSLPSAGWTRTPRLDGRLLLDGKPAADVEVSLLAPTVEGCASRRVSARTGPDGTFRLGGTWETWGCQMRTERWTGALVPIVRPLARLAMLGVAGDCFYQGVLEIRSGTEPPLQLELGRWAPGCPGRWNATCWLDRRRCDSDRIEPQA